MIRGEKDKLIIELNGWPADTLASLTDSLLDLIASADITELKTGTLFCICEFMRNISLDAYQIDKGLIGGERKRIKAESGEYLKESKDRERLLNENPELAYKMA